MNSTMKKLSGFVIFLALATTGVAHLTSDLAHHVQAESQAHFAIANQS